MNNYYKTFNIKVFSWKYSSPRASLITQLVKDIPAMQEIVVRFLGQEDPLEKG